MAVAEYQVNGKQVNVRGFHVPKRAAELKYWYKAAAKAIPQLPDYEAAFLVGADITVETIIMDWDRNGARHRLIIARKRQLW